MDLRVISLKKIEPNKFDKDITYEIPVRVLKIFKEFSKGPLVPIILERIDFYTGELKKTKAITFKKSLEHLNSSESLPFETSARVYKENNKIRMKVIGFVSHGLFEYIYDLENYLLDNDESQIIDLYNHNYQELRNWIGNLDSNEFDI